MNELMESSVEKPPQTSPDQKPAAKKLSKTSGFFRKHRVTIALIAIVLLTASCVYLFMDGISVGAKAVSDNFSEAYESEKGRVYQNLYQSAYERAEKNYHVSNRVIISVGDLEETGKLEVLKANDVEFITDDRDTNPGKVTAWLEVTGEGTFVVDLKAAEFIVDHERRYVLVRIPYPELTNVTITDTTKRWFKDDWRNGSYSQGVDLALKQRNEASLRIQNALMSNQYIYSNAQDVARRMISNLVKQFNSDVPDLTVEVEFMD